MAHDVAGQDGPQLPPPAMGAELPSAPLDRAEQVVSSLLAGDLQSGQETFLSDSLKEHLRSNFMLHFEHLYSYIGIVISF